ncbi:MAG: 3-hydroxyacyl-CoA dehydrogenase [Burkholderiales bacterium]|nr:3-hydroxyacyl-CoA dehydrogenase [Burkholderiales bacterium]
MRPSSPPPAAPAHAVVVGCGTMGSDVAIVLARGGSRVTLVDSDTTRSAAAAARVAAQLPALPDVAARLRCVEPLEAVDWPGVDLVVENIPEQLALKQRLFAALDALAPPHTLITSNSSGLPISQIGAGLAGAQRMFGLHFFMPAHLVPLVEVVMGAHSSLGAAQRLAGWMRACGSVPVLVRKDLPGFLANRLQHALAREAFALIDDGVASPEDVDAAVRFGFGFRFLAAGPVLQRDHGGVDVHCAAAATIYPSLSNATEPARTLREHAAAGHHGVKVGRGFFEWPDARRQADAERYAGLLRRGLALLADELPPTPQPAAPAPGPRW